MNSTNLKATKNYKVIMKAVSYTHLGDLGTISASGYFTAINTGNGEIIAEIDSISGSVPLTVGNSATIMIDDFSDLSGYTMTCLLYTSMVSPMSASSMATRLRRA